MKKERRNDLASQINSIIKENISPLEGRLGVNKDFFIALLKGDPADDWSFIVKLHALIEIAVAHYLTVKLGKPKLEDVFQRLELSDKRTGKIAFLKSLGLLEKYVPFIMTLSGIRNVYVHGVANVSLRLEELFKSKDNFIDELASEHVKLSKTGIDNKKAKELINLAPRFAIWFMAMDLMAEIYQDTP